MARDYFSFALCANGGHFENWQPLPPGVELTTGQYPGKLFMIHWSTCAQDIEPLLLPLSTKTASNIYFSYCFLLY